MGRGDQPVKKNNPARKKTDKCPSTKKKACELGNNECFHLRRGNTRLWGENVKNKSFSSGVSKKKKRRGGGRVGKKVGGQHDKPRRTGRFKRGVKKKIIFKQKHNGCSKNWKPAKIVSKTRAGRFQRRQVIWQRTHLKKERMSQEDTSRSL